MLDSLQHIVSDSLVITNAHSVELPIIARVTNWGTSPLIGITLIVSFLLFVIAFKQGKQFYLELLSNYFRDRDRMTYEEADNTSVSIIIMLTIALVTFSLFLTIVVNPTHTLDFSHNSLILWLVLTIVTSGWLIVQWLVFKYVGFVTNQTAIMRKFIRSFITTFVVGGLLLFPIVVGMIYAPPASLIIFVYIGLIIMLIGVLLVLFKAFQFYFTGFSSLCYLFLYLCTLEILPILLLKKAVVMWLTNV